MANVYAVKSGNWSDTTVWNTGARPTSADNVYANTFSVTIDITTTVVSISNNSATGIAAGGSFLAGNGITLTCTSTSFQGANTSAILLVSALTSGQSFTFVGNLACGTAIGARAANNTSSGTLNFIGNVFAGNNNGHGVLNSSTGTVNITGIVTGGNDVNGYGSHNSSTGTINIIGNVIAGGGTSSSPNYGANNTSTGILNITGNLTASVQCPAANNSSTGSLTVIGTISASGYPGLATGGLSQNTFLTGPFIGTAQGIPANLALRWRWVPSVGSSYMTVPNSTATGYKNLYTSDSTLSQSGQPAITNVRSGTIYGPNSELTGTCAVPAADSVSLGVPVDATTGTAVLTAANVRSAVGLASANLDTQLAAIPTTAAPTVTAIRTEMDSNSTKLANLDATISSRSTYAGGDTSGTTTLLGRLTSDRATSLDNLDTTISSRLDTSSYTTPPTVSEIAAETWSATTRTITTTIASAADNAAAVWSQPTREITGGTVDTLTNSPDVPSESEIASAVRTELTPELERVSNCATIETTGDQLAAFNP